MTLQTSALPGNVAARIDFDEDVRLDRLSSSDKNSLRAAFAHHSVLLIRGSTLDSNTLLALTRVLGEPEIHPVESIRLPGCPEVIEIVHTPETIPDGSHPGGPDEIVGRLDWHADLMYLPSPSRGALLHALEVPAKGGETAFIDTTLAFDALDESLKRELVGRKAAYLFRGTLFRERSRAVDEERFSEVLHPLLHLVPDSGRCALNVSPAAVRIDGFEKAESERLLRELHEHMTQERFVYVHPWQVGDLVIFNNMRSLHSAYGHERRYRRILHRTTLKGEPLQAMTREMALA
ncbi:MAG: TauD/TfdA family dioxygenase [Deltaproteobacteria bacterium]|nr:TauD/TfdA family dioxygenase [Deltaproteobacteria bacterium]MBW2496220.1 TauD/TfdA family dioxygenase [Deltaproteobacteria bacterium]